MKDSGSNHRSAAAETAAVARTVLNRHNPFSLDAEMRVEGHKFQIGTEERDKAQKEMKNGDSNRGQQVDGADDGSCKPESTTTHMDMKNVAKRIDYDAQTSKQVSSNLDATW